MAEKFRNVNVGRDFPVNEDAIEGFESSVKANMQIRALSYLVDIIKNQEARITQLEIAAELVDEKVVEAKVTEGLVTTNEAKKTQTRKPKAAEADE